MNTTSHHHDSSLKLAERTLDQLNELVRHGHFADYQTAIAVAVERLYAEQGRRLSRGQDAYTRLCGALQLGTTRASLRAAEHDRLDWESGHK